MERVPETNAQVLSYTDFRNLASRVKMLTPVDLPTYFATETLPAPYGNRVSLDQEKSRWLHWRERMDGCDVLSLTAKDFGTVLPDS